MLASLALGSGDLAAQTGTPRAAHCAPRPGVFLARGIGRKERLTSRTPEDSFHACEGVGECREQLFGN